MQRCQGALCTAAATCLLSARHGCCARAATRAGQRLRAGHIWSLPLPEAGAPHAQDFYEQGAKHRKLTWIYSLGQCTMTGHFLSRPVDLVLQGLQASVLLLFNDGEPPPSLVHARPLRSMLHARRPSHAPCACCALARAGWAWSCQARKPRCCSSRGPALRSPPPHSRLEPAMCLGAH